MSGLETWLVIIGLTAVTIGTRSFFLVLGDHVEIPERVQHALRYAPACALAALVAPEVLLPGGALPTNWHDPRLLAALAGIVTMLATRSMIATMVAGMAVFTALRFVA